jgi:predicted NBD/HSP70 family sugar kinase
MRYPRTGPRRAKAPLTDIKYGKTVGLRSGEIADRNIRVILEAIRRHGPLTRLELGQHVGLSGPGITNILRRLADDGLISSNRRNHGGGRTSSTEFALRPDGAFSIGVRLRLTRGELVLIDLSGLVHERRTFPVTDDAVSAVAAAVDDLLQSQPRDLPVVGLGIAAKEWTDEQGTRLAGILALPRVSIVNECVAALLAERTMGNDVPLDGLAMIIIDEDVQAGYLIRGMPFSGVHGKAGNIGGMQTGADKSSLDGAVGFEALRAVLSKADFERMTDGQELPGSPALDEWVRRAAGHLLDPILAIAGFVAPRTIMIGGNLPRGLIEALIHQLSIERRDVSVRPFLTPWISPLKPASFSGGGIALGAGLLPFLNTLLPPPAAG